ncbi:hypothetical protein [Blastopirellula retiformator]|uniref:Uncharacterized protein n=1 Tax=Blastopirellula retiformator TaxID=2527970 RepID=A0A5C5V4E3_9BACT|nr:hypothetical protein [Blastopirellula retiformator]TWT33416.1 hypothetical protein Enr8_32470 [Blastopirellula retiformator]
MPYDLKPLFQHPPSRCQIVRYAKPNDPTVHLQWLKPGDYTDILEEDEEMFGHLTTFGPAGYLCVFAADEL